ncbi:site-specific integrase [Bradyrhizobium sp. 18]|uniref:site-specific integrase n=1 Tax=Bradyrhizobium sp. 18 TaxID=2782657 RepID=UPI001FFA7193|nr:site-specific integrase [Bradyrhizobium sp. 18]MCK1506324.1 site-specific integrase [Bradyrhizobium sp. 18]
MAQPHLVRRGSTYYFRIAIPLVLIGVLERREYKTSLRTSDAILARMRARVLSNGLELIFRDIRSMAHVTSDVMVKAAQDYFRAQLSKSLELVFMIANDPVLDREVEIAGAKQLALGMQQQLAKQHFSSAVRSDAEELLKSINAGAVSKVSDTFQLACVAVLRAKIENAKLHAEQLTGNYAVMSADPLFAGIYTHDLPPVPGDDAKSHNSPTFKEVANQFVSVKSKGDWVNKTSADVKRVIALATELIGPNKAMNAVDIEDVKRVRNALSLLPPNYMKSSGTKGLTATEAMTANAAGKSLSPKTQWKYFAQFKQLLIWAQDEGFIEKIPGNNIKVTGLKKVAAGDQRDPYSADQLSRIFSSPLYTGHKSEAVRHKPGYLRQRDGYFWVPLIAAYSGMRLGEIVQLLKSDVKQDNGIWYFDIRGGEDKSLKTASSKRRVPIHPLLLQCGLLDLMKTGSPSGRLFPEIKKGADGYASHNFSKWWGRYAAHVGFKTDRTVFHSFRHNFLDALRATNSPEYVNKVLMGHTDNSVHGGYGSGATLEALKDGIAKVAYPIELSCLLMGKSSS